MSAKYTASLLGGCVICSLSPALLHADVFSVPETAGYTLAYDLNIPVGAAFNTNSIPYSVTPPASVQYGTFSRVGYYLELDNGQYAYTSFDAKGFTVDPKLLGVPSRPSGGAFQQNVTNMNVVSNVGGVQNGTGITTGNVEFWPDDYSAGNAKNVPNASSSAYDFGDQRTNGGDHGSMQIHNYGASQTIIAYNHWGNNAGGAASIGIGNDPNTSRANYSPDYTFADNAASFTTRHLQIVVGGPAQPSAPAAPAALVANAPELAGYKLIYQKALPGAANLNANGAAYNQDYSTGPNVAPGSFARVAYYLELQKPGGPSQFVEVSFKASDLSTDPGKLGIPTTGSGEFYQKNVTDMTITSNVGGITSGTHLNSGNVEFWPSNYSQANSVGVPNASDATFDEGDGGADGSAGYGSMQIHDHANGQVLLAYNGWGTGNTSDLGIGSNTLGNPNTSNIEPDWTFSGNANGYSVANLYVLVGDVPEPTSAGLIALGTTLLTLRRRR